MKAYARSAAACVLALSAYLSLGVAGAADLVVLGSQGAMPGLRALAAEFERVSGHQVTVIQATDAILEQRSRDGTADLATGNPGVLGELVSDGRVVADTVTPFVLAGLGVSVKAGVPKPDISTVEAYIAALRAAESIGYSRGCSGRNAAEGIEILGLTEELASKTTRTEGGPVTAYLARGEFELGIQQTNIMVGVPGSEYVGPVPSGLNRLCQTNVGLLEASSEPDAARELIRFMVSPEAGPILRATHVEPFSG